MKRQRIKTHPLVGAPRLFILCTLSALCALAVAWVRPQVPTDTKPATEYSAQLQHVVIEVNGAIHTVKNEETLRIVRGDHLKVLSGSLNDVNKKIETINVIGFNSSKSRRGDDRGIDLSTFDLQEKWSENKDNSTFAVIASSGKSTHGFVFLSLIEPVLKFVVLEVNGKEVVLRDGQPFVGKQTDKVRVKRVSTNVHENESVFVQTIPIKGREDEYEMRFLREKMVFARLQMKLER